MPAPARARAIAFCSLALIASIAARAAEATPEDLLRRMGVALRDVDFEGSFVYTHDGRTDALRIFHLGGAEERERLVSLTGARSEIVRKGRMITCLTPGATPTEFANRTSTSLLPLVPNVRELGEQYSVSAVGSDRVAGYAARVVELAPRDPYRYGYRLWLAEGNQLLLRSAVLDAARRPLEQFMFVALDIGSKPSETELAPAGDIGSAAAPVDEVATTTKPLWRIAEAPAGFRLVRTQRPLDGDPKAEHLVYSDGIASVSIYVEPHPDTTQAATESTIVRGVLSIHSRDAGGLRITAVGDVPPLTVQAMARGVRAVAAR